MTIDFLGGFGPKTPPKAGTKSVTGKPAMQGLNPLQQAAKNLANEGGLAGAKWLPAGWRVNEKGYGVIRAPIIKDKITLPKIK